MRIPELLQEHIYRDSSKGDPRIRATTREETASALIDLLAAEALDLADTEGTIEFARAISLVGEDSSWTLDSIGRDLEVVNNERSAGYLRDRAEGLSPHIPG